MRVRRSLLLTVSVVAVSGLVLAGCGSSRPGAAHPADGAAGAIAAAAAPLAAATATTCADGKPIAASIAPSGIGVDPASWPKNSTMAAIKKRGHLVVATNGDVLLWGATNTKTGDPEGYDVDLAAEVARKLRVDPARTVYKVIPYSARQSVLNDGSASADLVAQQMSISCAKWSGTAASGSTAAAPAINFSIPYYVAGARLLVRSDSQVTGLAGLKGQSVCGVTSSSSAASAGNAGVKLVLAPTAGQCLVKFEEGEAVAVIGDETTLAGFQKQDPSSMIVGSALAPGPYGLGTQPGQSDFTRFVNAVLVQLRADGTLTKLYDRWMKPTVGGSAPNLTQPVYGRDISGLQRKS